jgi:Uma2 family endonuclease
MIWQEAIQNPTLQNLPFKIEINQQGVLEMSPTSFRHGLFQTAIIKYLFKHGSHGIASVETPLQVDIGTRVPDVVWMTRAFYKLHSQHLQLSTAPAICIEVLSPANSQNEIHAKIKMYFGLGALEVWLCDQNGAMQFYDPNGQVELSKLIPEFPSIVQLDSDDNLEI